MKYLLIILLFASCATQKRYRIPSVYNFSYDTTGNAEIFRRAIEAASHDTTRYFEYDSLRYKNIKLIGELK